MPAFTFHPSAQQFDLTNALALAQTSELAYKSEDEVRREILNAWGFSQFRFFEKRETQAFLAASDHIIVFAFRGTSCNADWFTDAKIKFVSSVTGRIHFGFNEALGHIWEDMFKTFWEWEKPDKTLWFTGHSLGGALATLAASRLLQDNFPIAGLYTFGQPCVGDRAFSCYFKEKIKDAAYRFVNEEDLVPKLLPFVYCHVGRECFIARNGNIHCENNFWQWWRSVSDSVARRSSPDASRLKAGNPGGIQDHGMDFYIRAIKKNLPQRGGGTFKEYVNG